MFVCSFWLTSLCMTDSRFIHLTRMDLFLFRTIMCMCVCVYIYTHHNFFIHSSADGHLDCFPVQAIANSAAVNIGTHVSFWIMVFSVMGLLGFMVVLFLVLKESPYRSPQWLYQLTFPPTVQERIPFFPHPLQHLLFVDFFDDDHSDWCEMIPHCSFDWHVSTSTAYFW